MHPNPAFRKSLADQNLAFAATRGFGQLCVNGEAGPLISHVPFLLDEDGKIASFHLVRSNPIWRGLSEPMPAVLAVTGPDAYISPDWYDTPDQVPTWNYVAVHLRGTIRRLDDDALRPHLDALAAHFEGRLLPKRPWTADKMTDGVMERMMRMIAPCALEIETVDGTWKLNQNKEDAARLAAAAHLAKSEVGAEIGKLIDYMKDV